ncbi:LppM family (lipo)protein [Promicromonospora sp. CA-289599]|uniref:LppM family (lipo)protein n=1 Tax=Promicromonospora sp. CA-289599 TaxID=3240014 RepID=UPI003D8C6484
MNNARRALGAATLAASALLLSACMKMDVDLTLNSDDTATGTMLLAVSDRAAEAVGMTSAEMFKEMDSEDLGEGAAEVQDYAEDGFTGKRYVFEGSTLSEVSDETLQISRVGDEFVVDGTLPLTAEELGMTEEELSDPNVKPFLDTFDVNVTVAFPGEVSESNGTIDGNTVTWAAKIGEENKFTARGAALSPEEAAAAAEPSASPSAELAAAAAVGTSDQQGGFWGSLLGDSLIGAGVGLVVGLVFFAIRMARRRMAAATPVAHPDTDTPAGPPQP